MEKSTRLRIPELYSNSDLLELNVPVRESVEEDELLEIYKTWSWNTIV